MKLCARLRALAGTLAVMITAVATSAATKWHPLTPEDLNATPPEFAPDAGALILERDVEINGGRISDAGFDEGDVAYYVRIKVFDHKGVEAVQQLQLPYEPNEAPRGLAARVVKPDGTAVEVERDAIFTRELVRVGRESIRVKAFAFPALEPGCLIEYQYRMHPEGLLASMQLPMSDTFPIAQAHVSLRPLTGAGLSTQMLWSGQLHMQKLQGGERGVYRYEANNIAVAPTEPFSPPESACKPWFLFYLTPTAGNPREYWSYVAGDLVYGLGEQLKPKKAVKDAALRLTAGLTSDQARLQRLYDFCRTEIKNLSYDTSGYTPDEIEHLKPNRGPVDTLAHGYGSSLDINILFGALLKALGGDPSFAYLGDRSQYVFTWNLTLRAALPHVVVALSAGSDWKFYDPGAIYLPCGQLRWMNNGTSAIVVYGKLWKMIEVPPSPADYSTTRRTGRFRLDENGRLEGDVTLELTGDDGVAAKHEYDMQTDAQRRQAILDPLIARLGEVELTDVAMDNVTDPDQPITIRYHVATPGYAERTADRIFVPAAFFQKGLPQPFTATERHYPIHFPYAHNEVDDVTIELPVGWELNEPRAPAPVNVRNLFFYSPRLEYRRSTRELILHREYNFDGGHLAAGAYDAVKGAFARVHNQDEHAVELRRVAATPEDQPPG